MFIFKFPYDSSINVDGICVSSKDIRDVADRTRFLPAKVYAHCLWLTKVYIISPKIKSYTLIM